MKCTSNEKFSSAVIFTFPFLSFKTLGVEIPHVKTFFWKSKKFESFLLFVILSRFCGLVYKSR